jgi:hypothetical protein
LPERDPFAVAGDDQPWINGEWLFEAAIYPLWRASGHSGVSVAVALFAAALFAGGFLRGALRGAAGSALFIAVVSWFGALVRIDARPATLAMAFPPLALIVLESRGKAGARIIAYAVLTAVWINVHPSALIAPVLVVLHGIPPALARAGIRQHIWAALASAAALLVSPHGLNGVLAPLHLVRTIEDRSYVNLEWLPSAPAMFPLLYLTIAAAALVFLLRRSFREDAGHFAIFAIFAVLAMRSVRHQDLYFATLPFLLAGRLAGYRPSLDRLAAAAAGVLLIMAALGAPFATGLDPRRFPIESVERLKASGLRGNIFNADQLGGYLIWTFYPERRVLHDGRNELFDTYLAEYARARLDSRHWKALLEKYQVMLAVDEYHRETMTVTDAVSGARRVVPASEIYFPRERWALIAFDEAAMVFARRDAHSAEVIERWEIRRK